jgi:hypothetical protein
MPCKSKCAGACGGRPAAKAAAPKAAKPKEEKVDPTTLKAHKAITEKFGPHLEAKDLAELAHQAVNLIEELKKPSRTEERSAEKLYLWFETNWAKISPILEDLNLDDDEEEEEEDVEDE